MTDDVTRPRLCPRQANRAPSDLQQDETPFRYLLAEIRSRVVASCDPARYRLDHGGAVAADDRRPQPTIY